MKQTGATGTAMRWEKAEQVSLAIIVSAIGDLCIENYTFWGFFVPRDFCAVDIFVVWEFLPWGLLKFGDFCIVTFWVVS